MFALSFYIVCFRLSSPKAVRALPAGWNFEAGCLRRLIIDSQADVVTAPAQHSAGEETGKIDQVEGLAGQADSKG
jgi:hypothetical protein